MAVTTIDLGRVVGPQGPQGIQAPVDANPTSGSPNAVSSGGVYAALQGKADNPTGAVSNVMVSNLSPEKVVITDENGKLAASPVNASDIEDIAEIGTVYTVSLESWVETTANLTRFLSINLPDGVYVITAWCEIGRVVVDGRYGLQLYIGDSTSPVVTQQNREENPQGLSYYIGWHVSYIYKRVSDPPSGETETISAALLIPSAVSEEPVTITRGELTAVRIR